MPGLENKNVVVTGGGTGIGAACALSLVKAGANVLIGGRRLEPLEKLAAQAEGKIDYHVLDVADRESVATFFNWAADKAGHIDILVHCAGVNCRNRSMEVVSPEDWDRLMNVNATGAFNCMQAVLPQMRERRDGLIINICSVSGIRAALLGGVAYNASKFALTALGTTVAQEEKDRGIRISTIYPGEVETPILDDRPVPVSKEHRAKILQPEDVAAAVLMICQLPPRAHVSDLTIKPTTAAFV
ncbi:SDR family oxidoreductase [uncultured Gimesia sp.]|jgi:NADP-dependent 3-hydroxy acid dehydrogenase YdfG|uniref:SDR family oxidoreductase n=1 Tax=uncultured Gimesia sp. TaxID=1678688 RepID=UPI0026082D50|nr:SDR family oxidoreductase [uncultured Gimesia sp.]